MSIVYTTVVNGNHGVSSYHLIHVGMLYENVLLMTIVQDSRRYQGVDCNL